MKEEVPMEPDTEKQCTRCKMVKLIVDFAPRKNRKNRPNSQCRKCGAERAKESYLKNTKECLEKSKTFFKNNPDYGRKRYASNPKFYIDKCRDWQSKNRQKIRDYQNNRYKTDPNYRLGKLLRTRLIKALKRGSKTTSAIKLLGCTLDQFRAHLELKFSDGMTWSNMGKWEIDHISPCASFDLSDQIQLAECFSYKNLQPMWALDNRKKNSIVDGVKRYYYTNQNA